jgi:pimeloyl-ACP methyl ester carboxylesterase
MIADMPHSKPSVGRLMVSVDVADLEIFRSDPVDQRGPLISAAHPADAFGEQTVQLFGSIASAQVICVNPRGIGGSSPAEHCTLEQMVDDLEVVRQRLKLGPWVFWGMSGGGWLAQIYMHRHPKALKGIIIESTCACFQERLANPACVLSPLFPSWRPALAEAGLLPESADAIPVPVEGAEWIELKSVGQVFRKRNGPALLVSPAPLSKEMLRAMPMFLAFDSRRWLNQMHTPVPALIIAGTDDPVVPLAHARAVHEAISGSVFLAIDGGKHVPSLEQRPEIERAIQNFLSQQKW